MPLMKCGHLTVAELQVAEMEILRRVQEVAFPEVFNVLSATECCEDNGQPKKILRKAGASIRQLNLQLKEGLLRVGGRPANVPVGYVKKHPVIIPYKHQVTDLIIKQCHESLGHMVLYFGLEAGIRAFKYFICVHLTENQGHHELV